MTYCVGLLLDEGLVMLSDTRTNAGVDDVATFKKMTVWQRPGDRVICLLTAGNLAVSQAVISMLNEPIEGPDAGEATGPTILTLPTMFEVARHVGDAVRAVHKRDGAALDGHGGGFNVALLLGGQIKGRRVRLFQIYAAGNFIEATDDTPFLQLGEHKYGKPILDRTVRKDMGLVDGLKVTLLSMDSTLRSNLSVGLPVDVLVYRKDQLAPSLERRIEGDDPYISGLRDRWSAALQNAFGEITPPPWIDT